MHLSKHELAREMRSLDADNNRAMAAQDTLLAAALEQRANDSAHAGRRGLERFISRRVFTIAGFSVATAAVVAACSNSATEGTPINGAAPSTTVPPDHIVSDAVLLRTASSLEHNAITLYENVTPHLSGAAADAAKLFVDHHRLHAAAMEKATKDLGAEPYTKANPIVAVNVIDPAVAAAKTPTEILFVAHAVESVAAHTYQLMVAGLSAPKLRSAVMSIGGVEARHAAVLAKALGAPAVAGIEKLQPAGPTTTAGKDAVVAPAIYQVPGPFEPLGASVVLLTIGGKATLVSVDPLGPNSFMY